MKHKYAQALENLRFRRTSRHVARIKEVIYCAIENGMTTKQVYNILAKHGNISYRTVSRYIMDLTNDHRLRVYRNVGRGGNYSKLEKVY